MKQFTPITPQPITSTKTNTTPTEDLLIVRPANQWMEEASRRPIPRMLFSEFWHQGELCILFADTNLGKSILAVQIADAISRGVAISGFKLDAPKQKVLYFDFEMSDKQFEKRYSINYRQHYAFDDNFLRIEINPNCTDFERFETALFSSIERAIATHNAKVLIIDNLTYLKTQATETAKEALPLMKSLKELKMKHHLSILVVAHTPKRSLANPLTVNDLAGSKHLANFIDSLFAIGLSYQDKTLRYLIQLKARATELLYNDRNIALCRIAQPHNFLGFEFMEYGVEREHLRQPNDDHHELSEIDAMIVAMKEENPNFSLADIANAVGTNRMRVKRVLDKNGL